MCNNFSFCLLKEIVTLILAAKYNGDQINVINKLGLVILMVGIITHVIMKATSMKGIFIFEAIINSVIFKNE